MLSLSLSYIANIYFFNFFTKDRKFGTMIEKMIAIMRGVLIH